MHGEKKSEEYKLSGRQRNAIPGGLSCLPRGSSRTRQGANFSGKNHRGPPPRRQERSAKFLKGREKFRL